MQNPYRVNKNLLFPSLFGEGTVRILKFAPEIDAERRRKGEPPQGRADAPVRDIGGGGSSSGGGGGWLPSPTGNSGGSGLPTAAGGCFGGGCLKLPVWLIVIIIVLFFILGGGKLLGGLLGGGTSIPGTSIDQSPLNNPDTNAPAGNFVPTPGFTPPASAKSGTWTVMLYQDADDEILEQDLFTDFNEAERVGSTDQVHIVAQLDRFRGAYSGDGNWTSTRRYYITQDSDLNTINSQLVQDMGELNMSNPATLVDFATWAIQTFPADHYVLILSDHGMGWPGGWTDPAPASNTSERAPLAQLVGTYRAGCGECHVLGPVRFCARTDPPTGWDRQVRHRWAGRLLDGSVGSVERSRTARSICHHFGRN
jgi:Clostripain family